jgi:hypothetical protein
MRQPSWGPVPDGIVIADVEAATGSDRQFFIDNPTAAHRYRAYVPGEGPLPPVPPGHRVLIRVRQLVPGFRLREVLFLPPDEPDPSDD